ncbi:hypothetical protein BX616_002495 [Lobosporangium transversale]|nr:hypothetical protein BX616_002495 [Lobosporangium transversale]
MLQDGGLNEVKSGIRRFPSELRYNEVAGIESEEMKSFFSNHAVNLLSEFQSQGDKKKDTTLIKDARSDKLRIQHYIRKSMGENDVPATRQ